MFTAYDYDALRQNVETLQSLTSPGLVSGESAIVVSTDLPSLIKTAFQAAVATFGDRVAVCDGIDDDVEIQAAIDALTEGGRVTSGIQGSNGGVA